MRRNTLRPFVLLLLLLAQTIGMAAARRLHFAVEAEAFGHTATHLQTPGQLPCFPNPDHDCPACRILSACAVPGTDSNVLQPPPASRQQLTAHPVEQVVVHRLILPLGSRPPPST
jgi:hypothetical protein